MTAPLNSVEEAVAAVERARTTFRIPSSFAVVGVEPRYIEIVEGAPVEEASPPAVGRVRDALAWIVTLGREASAVECAVEVATSEIVRVRWSLGAVREDGPSLPNEEAGR